MKMGFIGFGEAAYSISSGLAENGYQGIIAYDKMQDHPEKGQLVHQRAQNAGVQLLPSPEDVARAADLLIVVVPGSYAIEACESVLPALRPGTIYADVSASAPELKEQLWDLLKDTGVLFADAALMGLMPVKRHLVPISVSGNGAQAFCDAVNAIGMKATVVGDRPGAASAIKLIRSVYMKGYDALLFEMLRAAEAYHVFDEIVANVGASMDNVPFTTLIEWMFPGLGVHAVRRSAEMKATQAMLDACGIDSAMTAAIKHQLDLVADLDLDGYYNSQWPQSKDWRELFHYVNEKTGVKSAT